MKRINEYRILVAKSIVDLEIMAEETISTGDWQLQGGVAVMPNTSTGNMFLQAVITIKKLKKLRKNLRLILA